MSWLLPPLPPNFEAALRDVHAKGLDARVAAAQRLGRASAEERTRAVSGLAEMLVDEYPSVRSSALVGLAGLEAHQHVEAIAARLDDPSAQVRELAALALVDLGGETAEAALRKALQHEAPEVRFQAISGLVELLKESAVGEVLPLAQDADAEIRAQVALAIGSLGQVHLSGHLAGLLEDPSSRVRLEAALALATLGDARGELVLLSALESRDRAEDAAMALAQLGTKKSIEPIAKIATSWLASGHLRAVMGAALVRLGDPRGEAALHRVLRGFRADARGLAVELAGASGAAALAPELVRLVHRPRGIDPISAVEALGKLASTSQTAERALQGLRSQPGEIGLAAQKALGPFEPPKSQGMP
jgi:HEAT repeat protein